jgi:hypothetical protein
MANTILTLGGVTRLAVTLFHNNNLFLQNIDKQYDDSFAKEGAKIGQSLKIRLPNDYTVRSGAALASQDTTEQSITLPVATQKGVDMSFTSIDMTMAIDDFAKRIMAPAVNALAGQVAMNIMLGVEGGISNFVANTDGTGAVLTPTAATILQARAILANNSAPSGDRKFIVDPITNARAVSFLAGLFNPSQAISEQYRSGMVSNALGFDWYEEPTVIKHTTSSYSGSLTVNGATQTGTTLVVNAITGGFAAGDIIQIAGVNAVNRVTKATTGAPQQFVITAAASTGATSLSIYPAIIPGAGGYVPASGVNGAQYQTVDVSPANGAVITCVTKSAAVYRKNFVFVPEAVTMVTADLIIPPNVESAREELNGVSMRMVRQYAIGTDVLATRLDILFGYVFVRPEWGCVVGDVI